VTDEPPVPQIAAPASDTAVTPHLPMERQSDGSLVIDLLPLAPPPKECAEPDPDPFSPEIVVCRAAGPSPRLGPAIGPEDDGSASAIPRARLKLSDKAAAEANATAPSVGGWNAQGGEVRLKIDF
jgi:hypothetical protein